MSKRETPLTRRYWQEIGGTLGTLIEEFPAVRCTTWERVGLVPKRSHGWVVPDTVHPARLRPPHYTVAVAWILQYPVWRFFALLYYIV